jgi:acyl carrier protein
MLLRKLAEDWDYSGTIGRDTRMLADLGLESLDIVILSVELQQHYHQPLPFTQFFEDIGARGAKDVTVGEWIDFVFTNLNAAQVGATA